MSKDKIIFLTGPTATGKSAMALQMAECLPIEIISVDSAMVYRGLNIGTGKPTPEILKQIPHHLVDIRNPNEYYSCGQFREESLQLIKKILSQGKIPLLVGGTMLYYKALKDGLAVIPKTHLEIRQRLKQEINQLGSSAMHARLGKLDPVTAKRVHPNDPQRILRALEIFEQTGKPLSSYISESSKEQLPYEILPLALTTLNRQVLHHRIEERFYQMLKQGFVEEVHHLRCIGLPGDLPSLRSVGYRQIGDYLDKKYSYQEMLEKSMAATRQLAKRQLTWLRAFSELKWFDCENKHLILQIKQSIETFIN